LHELQQSDQTETGNNHQTVIYDDQKLEAKVRKIVKQKFKEFHETVEIKLPESLHQDFENENVENIIYTIEGIKKNYLYRIQWRLHELQQSDQTEMGNNHQTKMYEEKYDDQKVETLVRKIVKQKIKVIHETAEIKLPESLHQKIENDNVRNIIISIEFIKYFYLQWMQRRVRELQYSGQ
jgi:hypothetical protein